MDLSGCFAPAKILLKNLRVDFKDFTWESEVEVITHSLDRLCELHKFQATLNYKLIP